ncbi:MAG: hypothetical protein QOC95_65, partial [Thermoleophilaceae bacterium]|nr:hypothetical protein [Thermoleophilaceae bacterium]
PASASTQVGSTPTSDQADQSCSPNTTVVQDVTAAGSPSYTIPAGGGVITSWSYLARSTPGRRKLKIMRPTATSGQYLVTGESSAETPAPGQLNTFNARIPVTGGDLLALYMDTGDGCRTAAASGNTVRGGSSDPAVGSGFSGSSLFASSTLIDVSATIEPDADGDGYGDETQDGCPGDPTVYATPCSADVEVTMTAGPASVRLGDAVAYTVGVRNLGPTVAHDLALKDVLPLRAPLVSAPANCTGFATLTCKLDDLAPGATATAITIVIRAPEPGTLANTITATSSTLDPSPDNNAATASVLVEPPIFQGAAVGGGKLRVKRDKVPVRVSCPISARTCKGRLTLTTAKRIRLTPGAHAARVTLGSVALSLVGGHRRTLQVPLSSKGKRALKRYPRIASTATSAAVDSFSQSTTRKKAITILAAKKRGS